MCKAWQGKKGLIKRALDASGLDETIVEWFDLLFLRGHSASDGSKFLAALQHLWPQLRCHSQLPRARRALKGWEKLRPCFPGCLFRLQP